MVDAWDQQTAVNGGSELLIFVPGALTAMTWELLVPLPRFILGPKPLVDLGRGSQVYRTVDHDRAAASGADLPTRQIRGGTPSSSSTISARATSESAKSTLPIPDP